jgi:hypothetical protein
MVFSAIVLFNAHMYHLPLVEYSGCLLELVAVNLELVSEQALDLIFL